MFQTVARFMSRLPPGRHRAVRAHFAGLFTPRRVQRYRERIAARVDVLLAAFPPDGGPVDLVAAFSRPLPLSVIADVLGVPAGRHGWLAQATQAFGQAVAGQRDHAHVERGNAAAAEMLAYFDQALTERAASPRQDVLSLLAATPADAERRADLLANCILFVLAGHMTTATLLSAGVALLTQHRDQLGMLLAHPGRWPGAIDELLRLVSPTTVTAAMATADAVVGGTLIRAGTQPLLVLAAANRDPAVFDDPDRFDVTRSPNPHLAFAAGAHYCLGAPLARLHAEIALPALFTRLPGLRPAGALRWGGSVPVRQAESLPVMWN